MGLRPRNRAVGALRNNRRLIQEVIYRRAAIERLESRLPLDSSGCSHDPDDTDDDTAAALSLPAADDFRISEAGSTFATAYDLGQLSGKQSLGGAVGGADPSDVVRFTLATQSRVDVSLAGLSSDIDLALYNSAGQRIGLSNRSGAASEAISQTLAAGTYYVVVTPWGRASSSYVLGLGATSTATTPTTPTAPTTPTTPTTPGTAFPDVAYFGGSNDWGLNAINAPEAWAQGYTGQGVVVAVVDTGVDMNHPDLMSQLWVNADEIAGNGIDDDRNGYVDDRSGWDFSANDNNPDDGNGHGTHVAGIIAADANGVGATGVAPDATIMPVRVLGSNGSGSAASVAAGIRYAAANGADIINLSLGGAFSSVIQAAIQYAQQLNVLVVVAAGNESASTPSYPARFSSSLSSVLSVGAYSSSNSRASFSNRVGTSGAVQVDAPGVNVYSTYIDGRYANLSGTSMATPEVAGLAALALSANSNLTAAQLRTLIVNGANRTIAGSDSRGGVNAALTVALAASGQSSASAATATAQAVQSAAAQTIAVRRFIVSSFADAAGSATPSSAASNTADAPSRSLLTSQLRFAEAESDSAADSGIVSRAAHDQALMAYCDADEAELAGSDANVDIYSWLDAHLSAAIGQGRRLASGRPSIDYHMVV